MPIYEYHCYSCSHRFEVLQKMNASPIDVCPSCDQPTVKRLVSAAGFELKGTGWYATDFKKSTTQTAEKQTSAETKGEAQPCSQGTACQSSCASEKVN